MKRVRVTIEMDANFIKFLNLWCLAEEVGPFARRPGAPIHRLASTSLVALVLAEARGAPPDQVADMVHDDWAGQIRAIHEDRKVEEVADVPADTTP